MSDRSDVLLDDGDYQAQAAFRYELRRFLRSSDEHAQAIGISPQQHQALLAIRGHPSYPDVIIADVAAQLLVRHHTASLLVDRMVKKGLLVRQQDRGDQRRVLVSLTVQGEQQLEEITARNRRSLQSLEYALAAVATSLRRVGRHAHAERA